MTGGAKSGRDRKTWAPARLVTLGAANNWANSAVLAAPARGWEACCASERPCAPPKSSAAAVPVTPLPRRPTRARRLSCMSPFKGRRAVKLQNYWVPGRGAVVPSVAPAPILHSRSRRRRLLSAKGPHQRWVSWSCKGVLIRPDSAALGVVRLSRRVFCSFPAEITPRAGKHAESGKGHREPTSTPRARKRAESREERGGCRPADASAKPPAGATGTADPIKLGADGTGLRLSLFISSAGRQRPGQDDLRYSPVRLAAQDALDGGLCRGQ